MKLLVPPNQSSLLYQALNSLEEICLKSQIKDLNQKCLTWDLVKLRLWWPTKFNHPIKKTFSATIKMIKELEAWEPKRAKTPRLCIRISKEIQMRERTCPSWALFKYCPQMRMGGILWWKITIKMRCNLWIPYHLWPEWIMQWGRFKDKNSS